MIANIILNGETLTSVLPKRNEARLSSLITFIQHFTGCDSLGSRTKDEMKETSESGWIKPGIPVISVIPTIQPFCWGSEVEVRALPLFSSYTLTAQFKVQSTKSESPVCPASVMCPQAWQRRPDPLIYSLSRTGPNAGK